MTIHIEGFLSYIWGHLQTAEDLEYILLGLKFCYLRELINQKEFQIVTIMHLEYARANSNRFHEQCIRRALDLED